MRFTYLDLVDPTIAFSPIMATNWFPHPEKGYYSLFTPNETEKWTIPGYQGSRCIIEIEMAKQLSLIQQKLSPQGLSLKVYDAYRPQKAVCFFTEWTQLPDTQIAKKMHYPRVDKRDFHALSYLSQTSSHTLGTAVDVTIIRKNQLPVEKKTGFLGLWDAQSLDMGNLGYLTFDERSWHSFDDITHEQKQNRKLLYDLMTSHAFEPLDTEFWHYYFKPSRNKGVFYDFDVRNDYGHHEDLTLKLNS